MANKRDSLIAKILAPPIIVYFGIMMLWENEGRFDYAKAAHETTVITSPSNAPSNKTVSMTGNLDTEIPISGEYVEQFMGYHVVSRRAEIYAWERNEDSEGRVSWDKEWMDYLENNNRNRKLNLKKTLHSTSLYPPKYQLEDLTVIPARIHFVDDYSSISIDNLTLSETGRSFGLKNNYNYLYKSINNEVTTQLGDERLSYSGVRNASPATYFGLLKNGTATGKKFKIGNNPKISFQNFSFELPIHDMIKNDGILHHIVNGEREQALKTMKSHITWLKWKIRGAGTLAIILGIFLFFSYFVNLLYRIPLLGDMIQAGVLLVSIAIGIPIALLVMLSSAMVHHPIIIVLPLILLIGAVILIKRQSKKASVNVQRTLDTYEKTHNTEMQTNDASTIKTSNAEVTIAALIKIAMTDGNYNKKENKFIRNWALKNGITESRVDELFLEAKQSSEQHEISRNDVIIMACLAMADGLLSERERSYLNKIGWTIGLTQNDIREIIIGIEEGTLAPS
jgi:tellurite resistance protein